MQERPYESKAKRKLDITESIVWGGKFCDIGCGRLLGKPPMTGRSPLLKDKTKRGARETVSRRCCHRGQVTALFHEITPLGTPKIFFEETGTNIGRSGEER